MMDVLHIIYIIRLCGYAVMRLCGCAVMRLCGYAVGVVSMAAIISMASMARQLHDRNVNLRKLYNKTKTVQPHNRPTAQPLNHITARNRP